MITTLLRQVLRENRSMLTALLATLLCCIAIWYAAIRQQQILYRQQQAWHAGRSQAGIASLNSQQQDAVRATQILSALPATHQLPDQIGAILDLMAQHHTTPGNLTYKQVTSPFAGIRAYNLSCSATGSYPALKRLTAALERLQGISVLDSVTLAQKDIMTEDVTLDAQISIYLREGQP